MNNSRIPNTHNTTREAQYRSFLFNPVLALNYEKFLSIHIHFILSVYNCGINSKQTLPSVFLGLETAELNGAADVQRHNGRLQ